MERIKLNKLRNWYASFRNCMIDSTFEISVLEAVIKQLKIDIKKLYGLLHV